MKRFDGALAYVCGGSLGIGLAIAQRLASLGADVVVFARRREPLLAAVAAIQARRRRAEQRVAWRQLDVADRGQVREVISAAVSELGVPDLLVNCAGRAFPNHFASIGPDQLEATLRVNLVGCWDVIQALLPHLKARGSGWIVNVSSLAGLIGVFGYTDYCASKFALVGFSEALRSELKRDGIAVSVLCPPDVATPGFERENQTKPEETRAVSAGAKLLSPEEVAEALTGAMAKRPFLIIPGFEARLTFLAKRLVPGLVAWAMDRRVRSVQRPTRG